MEEVVSFCSAGGSEEEVTTMAHLRRIVCGRRRELSRTDHKGELPHQCLLLPD